jgi:hypothetical protein
MLSRCRSSILHAVFSAQNMSEVSICRALHIVQDNRHIHASTTEQSSPRCASVRGRYHARWPCIRAMPGASPAACQPVSCTMMSRDQRSSHMQVLGRRRLPSKTSPPTLPEYPDDKDEMSEGRLTRNPIVMSCKVYLVLGRLALLMLSGLCTSFTSLAVRDHFSALGLIRGHQRSMVMRDYSMVGAPT